MAGTRVEKIGSIYTRVRGLILSGALKHSERPLWYDVYETFPPLVESKVKKWSATAQSSDRTEPRNIIYREDFIRAKFYEKYGTIGAIDLMKNSSVTVCQRFIQICWKLQGKGLENQQIFAAAEEELKQEGVSLETMSDIEEKKAAKLKAAQSLNAKKRNPSFDVTEIFGSDVTTTPLEDEPDSLSTEDKVSSKPGS